MCVCVTSLVNNKTISWYLTILFISKNPSIILIVNN